MKAPHPARRKKRWSGMAMEELLAVQELEKRLAEQYAEAQAEAKNFLARKGGDRMILVTAPG